MYWEGKKPEHIKLCIESIRQRKGHLELHLLNPTTIAKFLPNLRPEWHHLQKPAHKADYIRTRLAYKYGGMWIDCDMIALAELEPLFKFPEQYDYACQNISTSIGCFIARPQSKILERVISEQDKILDHNSVDFMWNDIGNNLLKKFGQNYPYYRWQEWTLDEIAGGKTSKLFSRHETIDENLDSNAMIFHLCNESISKEIKIKLKDTRVIKSNTLISKIFRKSLSLKEKNTAKYDIIENLLDYNIIFILSLLKSRILKKFNE